MHARLADVSLRDPQLTVDGLTRADSVLQGEQKCFTGKMSLGKTRSSFSVVCKPSSEG